MRFYAYLNGIKPVGSSRSHLIIFAMTLNHVYAYGFRCVAARNGPNTKLFGPIVKLHF